MKTDSATVQFLPGEIIIMSFKTGKQTGSIEGNTELESSKMETNINMNLNRIKRRRGEKMEEMSFEDHYFLGVAKFLLSVRLLMFVILWFKERERTQQKEHIQNEKTIQNEKEIQDGNARLMFVMIMMVFELLTIIMYKLGACLTKEGFCLSLYLFYGAVSLIFIWFLTMNTYLDSPLLFMLLLFVWLVILLVNISAVDNMLKQNKSALSKDGEETPKKDSRFGLVNNIYQV